MQRALTEQAWSQGFDAGTRLLPSSRNPYKVGSDRHEAWFDGWCGGSQPDLDETEQSEMRRLGSRNEKRSADDCAR